MRGCRQRFARRRAFATLSSSCSSRIAACEAQVLVAEAGASPLEPYNGAIVVEYLRDLARFTVLCASDPYAVLGVQTAYGAGLRADLVTGPAANTEAAITLVRELVRTPGAEPVGPQYLS